jgi:hypothetical protein
MYIPPEDPWGSAEDYKAARDNAGPPDNVNQVIDVTAKVIGKRRSARDAAKNFLKNKARQAQQSTAGQKVAQVAGATAQNIGQNPMFQQAMGAMQNLPGGPLPYAMGATALGTAGVLALRQKMKQDAAAKAQAAAVNPAAQMPLY